MRDPRYSHDLDNPQVSSYWTWCCSFGRSRAVHLRASRDETRPAERMTDVSIWPVRGTDLIDARNQRIQVEDFQQMVHFIVTHTDSPYLEDHRPWWSSLATEIRLYAQVFGRWKNDCLTVTPEEWRKSYSFLFKYGLQRSPGLKTAFHPCRLSVFARRNRSVRFTGFLSWPMDEQKIDVLGLKRCEDIGKCFHCLIVTWWIDFRCDEYLWTLHATGDPSGADAITRSIIIRTVDTSTTHLQPLESGIVALFRTPVFTACAIGCTVTSCS